MAFSARELSVLAYANGFTLWHYRSADPSDELLAPAPGYFAAADELLRPGDQILLTLAESCGLSGAAVVVRAVRPGAVELRAAGWPGPSGAGPASANEERPPRGEGRPLAELGPDWDQGLRSGAEHGECDDEGIDCTEEEQMGVGEPHSSSPSLV
ncbi:MAG: hypothetical protein BroJett029_22270 [Alphaproteobacteria bacterium]|nr:MAG: hypothetical protein BroJett029_22270 [Alphaproteobacteria bacterium]